MKIFEYSSLGKQLNTQTDIAKKQYQGLNKLFKSDEKEEPVAIKTEKQKIRKYNKSDQIYNSKYSFQKYYRYNEKFGTFSIESKYSFLAKFLEDLNKFNKLNPQKESSKKIKIKCV